ncbi:MAG: helix-turn-helix transcriptional regulator [Cyanobacteria bacterium P01_H01_bin.121]
MGVEQLESALQQTGDFQAITEELIQLAERQFSVSRITAVTLVQEALQVSWSKQTNPFEPSTDIRVPDTAESPASQAVQMFDRPPSSALTSTHANWQTAVQVAGDQIRQWRLNRGWTLRQLHHQCKISIYNLQALELGYLDQLPEPIFVEGFILQAANALGQDGKALVRQLPNSNYQTPVIPDWYQQAEATVSWREFITYGVLVAGSVGLVNGLSQHYQSTAPHPTPLPQPLSNVRQKFDTAKLELTAIPNVAHPEIVRPEVTKPEMLESSELSWLRQ